MKSLSIQFYAVCIALILVFSSVPVQAAEPIPQISISTTNTTDLMFDISNVATGGTYYIEQLDQLATNNSWQEVYSFEGSSSNANWNAPATNTSGFFRVLREPYHAKVGQTATFTTHYHNVMGTAHIVNNHTIELRNFYYDGTGIDVHVIVSPNASFSPYTSISGNLLGPAYTNATLTFTLPDNITLDYVSYISIWCVPVSINFGDGMFQ